MRLDATRRETMTALTAPSRFHGAIESAFSGERRRRLWRIDRLGGERYLLLVSEDQPDLTRAAEQFGFPGDTPRWETRDYAPLLERVQTGSVWQFRLTANPVVSLPPESHAGAFGRGTVTALLSDSLQQQWLTRRAASHGFSLDPDAFRVTEIRRLSFRKPGVVRPVSLEAVTYEGVLTVTDPALFRELLTRGIGREKAYGMGMLTVARPRHVG